MFPLRSIYERGHFLYYDPCPVCDVALRRPVVAYLIGRSQELKRLNYDLV